MLIDAIKSVNEFVEAENELIVIDNASSDGTEDTIRSLFPEVIFIANAHNAGFSAANNQGAMIAKGEFILLMNPDAKLIDERINAAIRYLQTQPNTLIGPKILNPDLSLQDSVFAYPTFIDVFVETFFLEYFFKRNWIQVLDKGNYALSGACLLITKQNYKLLKGLDNDLFWMDDIDFCLRAKKNKIEVKYFSDWTIIHVVGQSSKNNFRLSISNQLISKLKYFKKHNDWINFFLSVILVEFHIVLRIVVLLPLALIGKIYRVKFLAYWYTQSLFLKYIFTNKKQTF